MPVTTSPFGAYANVTQVISAAAQTAVLAECDKMLALLPNANATNAKTAGVAGVSPLFDEIPPATALQLRVELTALKTAIDAAPTA